MTSAARADTDVPAGRDGAARLHGRERRRPRAERTLSVLHYHAQFDRIGAVTGQACE